jgi:ABC-type Fe3+-hydroxamate transport system substrate-binding protein
MDRELVFAFPPRRIVSLVPSETDTLFSLGLGDTVVGRTRYCVEPAGRVDSVPICGGTKDVDVDAVAELAPDLILANQEENSRPNLEDLARRGHPVFVSFPRRVADGISHMARVAKLCGVAREPAVVDLLRRAYALLRDPPAPTLDVFVPIWMDPLMTMNADTFGSDALALAGARNVFSERVRLYPLAADLGIREPLAPERTEGRDTRYPRITVDEVVARAPGLILLPDEPHPFSAADADVFRALDIPGCRVQFCDGKDLLWYGARSVVGISRLRETIAAAIA